MADFKRQMIRNLRSAKTWLARAEESFDKDSNIRGELDLLLAQAELRHAQETNRSRQWRYKYPLIRHALSLILAAAIVTIGFGAFWWVGGNQSGPPSSQAAPEPRTISASKAAGESAESPIRAEEPQPAIAKSAITKTAIAAPVPVTAATEERQEKAERPHQTEKENLLPPEEMQKVIRAAGKTLRGQ